MNAMQTSRRPILGAELINILLGIWVAISPFVLGFSRNTAVMLGNIAVGIALVLVSLAGAFVDEAFEGLVMPLGTWLFISAFVFGFWTLALPVNNVAMAFIVIAAGAISDALRVPVESNS